MVNYTATNFCLKKLINGKQSYSYPLQFFFSSLENGVGQTIQRSEIPKDKEGMYQEKDAV